jgi:DNA (cytosine-5)-methyltransferase 1
VTLRLLDTFSGIGGFSLAARWLGGFETVQFVEVDPFCRRILKQHWPGVPIHQDICNLRPKQGFADAIVGGFPCQDISVAGKQRGIKDGTRSGLFYELMRVICLVRPRYVVLENVAAIVNEGLDTVLGALAEAGYDCEWACIKASDVGACHQRDRWWCVAYSSHSGTQAPRPEQQTAEAEQHRELVANAMRKQCKGSRPQGQRQSDPQRTKWQPVRSHQGPAISPDWRTYVSEPVLRRGNDGLSGRVDRLKALGNAVVPHVAMIALSRVLELERQRVAAEESVGPELLLKMLECRSHP